MRVCLSAVLFVTAGFAAGSVSAQSPLDGAAGLAEVHSSSDMSSTAAMMAAMRTPTSGVPFEGRKVTKSVWRLADGTVITHEADTDMARDSEGRVREAVEGVQSSSVGAKQSNHAMEMVTIGDPVDHSITMLTPTAKLAMRMDLPDLSGFGKSGHKLLSEELAGVPPPPLMVPKPHAVGTVSLGTLPPSKVGGEDADQVTTEELGKQSIAGVLATGKRTTTVIPLGKIGNDRPITIVHEEWYSPDLQMVVKSVDSDPRSGERTMELENVSRAAPDAGLFKAPEGYKVMNMGDMMQKLGSVGRPKTDAAVQP